MNDNYGCVLSAQPGQSQGRPITTAGSRPIVSTAYPTCVLPKAPVPVEERYFDGLHWVEPSGMIFMPVQPSAAAPCVWLGSPELQTRGAELAGPIRVNRREVLGG